MSKSMYCPHFATSDGITRFCMNGRFPCDCETCNCLDKRLVDITTTNNTKDLFKVEVKMPKCIFEDICDKSWCRMYSFECVSPPNFYNNMYNQKEGGKDDD